MSRAMSRGRITSKQKFALSTKCQKNGRQCASLPQSRCRCRCLACCRGCCCCLCLRIQPQLLLDAVSGTHALDQSCEDDDAADKLQCQCVVCVGCVCVCGVCCICIDDNYMSATATPDDDADDYGAPAGYRTICTKCRHCFRSVSSLSFICPCVHPCSTSQSVSLSALHCHLAHAAY